MCGILCLGLYRHLRSPKKRFQYIDRRDPWPTLRIKKKQINNTKDFVLILIVR